MSQSEPIIQKKIQHWFISEIHKHTKTVDQRNNVVHYSIQILILFYTLSC